MAARRFEFVVQGLPPRPGEAAEAQSARELRRAATDATDEPLPRAIILELELHLPPTLYAGPGELDTFVSGVRDGLMTARGERFGEHDDACLVSFVAHKIKELSPDPWYRVVVESAP